MIHALEDPKVVLIVKLLGLDVNTYAHFFIFVFQYMTVMDKLYKFWDHFY